MRGARPSRARAADASGRWPVCNAVFSARAGGGARPRVDHTAGVCRRGSGRPDRAVRGGQADRKRLGPRSEGLIVAGLVDNIRFVYEPYKFVRWE
ncbi:pseudouridine synthase [Burkholderia pseudomallei]|uniref:pseudouridine synthase n=1 Tax=Burkholderia pseudomallei TaxID=28450 RepID=UPI000976727B|nr:pseudouridine synthase [Burkholderia pseudomallei]